MKPWSICLIATSLFAVPLGCADTVDELPTPPSQGDNPSPGTSGNGDSEDHENGGNTSHPGNSNGGTGNSGSGGQTGDSGSSSGSNGNSGTSSSMTQAEEWARKRIAHTVSTEEAFNAIAYDTGFPVLTRQNTVIFMHWYEGGSWSVAGGFNQWNPQPMTQDGDIWYAEVPIPENTTDLGYKFVNTEGNAQEYVADPWALRQNYDENGELSYLSKPTVPHLMRWNNFKSPEGLSTRAIRAYIPANDGPYDVVYAHDGQNLFENTNASWMLPSAMAQINGNFLVVGIDNTPDRFSEYTHVDDTIEFFGSTLDVKANGDNYAHFVDQTVRPFIESKFSTTSKAAVMGSSLGGLISLYIAHHYPGRYKAALALSPTTAWGDFTLHQKTIQKIYEEQGHQSTAIYVDWGGNEGSGCKNNSSDALEDENSRDNYCYSSNFVQSLKNLGYIENVDLKYVHDANALHNEAAWASRVSVPLSFFMSLK